MNKKFFGIIATLFFSATMVACSDSDDSNPFDQQKKGDFNPSEVIITKSSDNRTIVESWKNIRRNYDNKVTSYEYNFELNGDITQFENRSCTMDYFTDHNGNEQIRSKYSVEYAKSDKGITEKYTESIQENVTIDPKGYISRIETTIDHYANNSSEPVTTTSERVFTYSGDLCTGSTYRDEEYQISYKYNWSGYQLRNITVLKENKKDGSIEYNTYDYTFDNKRIYPYSGTSLMPFVQSGLPQIYASMGYLGKCTPYELIEEVQGGYTKFGNMTSNNIKVHNLYNLEGDLSVRFTYSALSNIYNNYSITFNK